MRFSRSPKPFYQAELGGLHSKMSHEQMDQLMAEQRIKVAQERASLPKLNTFNIRFGSQNYDLLKQLNEQFESVIEGAQQPKSIEQHRFVLIIILNKMIYCLLRSAIKASSNPKFNGFYSRIFQFSRAWRESEISSKQIPHDSIQCMINNEIFVFDEQIAQENFLFATIAIKMILSLLETEMVGYPINFQRAKRLSAEFTLVYRSVVK